MESVAKITSAFEREEDSLLFSTVKTKNRKSGYSIVLYMYPKLFDQSGFHLGERVDLLFDKTTKEGALVRSSKGRRINFDCIAKVVFPWEEGVPSIERIGIAADVSAGGGRIEFIFPENTSFNGIARSEKDGRIRPHD